jgi:predicted ATP-grasp superfamily ATP-dependent carboligase
MTKDAFINYLKALENEVFELSVDVSDVREKAEEATERLRNLKQKLLDKQLELYQGE